ncbi:MAG: hypothetical protein ACXWDO_08270 [Bacteroidia bacterium]
MRSTKLFRALLFVCLSVFVFASCKDEDGNPTIQKPVLAVTPTISTVGAGDEFPFSVDGSGFNKLTKFTVEETYGGKKRIVLDSTFNPAKTGISFAYNYHVPDTAIKGQVITLTFSLTDEAGNVTTDVETFTVSYSTPAIKLTADKTEASVGDTVFFSVAVTSAVPNLKNLEISESINGSLGTPLENITIPANSSTFNTTYQYVIPDELKVGQFVVVLFKAINDEGTAATATQRITIK